MSSENTVLSRGSYRESQRVSEILSKESTGGIILLVATIAALIFANSAAAEHYFGLRDTYLGADFWGLHLKLSIGHWAADGLLAVFFFLVGLELKKEFVEGDLRNPGKALVPIVAAAGGVALPAIIYTVINLRGSDEAIGGWAIPAATDIAFAVAVLAVIGSHLPSALRTFLLTLAVVDDLIAITIIAIFYTSDLQIGYLALSIIPIALYALIARKGEKLFHLSPTASWLILLPIGFVTWVLFLNSGIHATIAGVILAFMIPVRHNKRTKAADADHGLAEVMEHRIRPFSAGFCVPVFAFFSAGVAIGGVQGFMDAVSEPIAYGIIAALILGKMIGITASTWLVTRLRHANLDPDIAWIDVIGVATLAGIGFTVSLLIAELSFGLGSPHNDAAKVAILTASVGAALGGATILSLRNKHYKQVEVKESLDENQDGIPDVFSDDSARVQDSQ
ncbi:Na+/H+ antiporter NhaA [Rothia sp. CCM 9417]|uniref:Na+/H+ antiporter NhaA n=1 Tax=unclassified Rothia (in: high G+C Gram-positive bacteria) TaxID=2689056 RepID=UPI003ABE9CA4